MTLPLKIPASGDQFPTRWAFDALRPCLVSVDDIAALREYQAQLDAVKAYQEAHRVVSIEAAKAIALVDLRVGELLGDPEAGGRGKRSSAPEGFDKDERHELRLLVDHGEHVLAAIEAAETDGAVSRRALLRIARQHRREDTPAEPSIVSGEGWELRAGDFVDVLADLPDASVDLVLTDPPYPAEDLPLWSDLAKLAARVLGPRGLLVAYAGQIFLPEVLERLGEHLTYGWMYCLDLRAGARSRIMGRHVIQTWKPVVAFSTGTWPSGAWHDDLVISPARDKFEYSWQQHAAPAQRLIERLSPRNGLVVDPFAGTGTFGLAARAAGRRFIGAESDRRRMALCSRRLRGEP